MLTRWQYHASAGLAMTLVETLPLIDGVLVADANGSVVFWNRAAEVLFGYTAEEALQLGVAALLGIWPPASSFVTARRKDGTTFLAEIVVDWLEQALALISIRDVWGDEALSLINELDDVGAFDRDLVKGESRWSDELFRIYGLSPAEHPPPIDEIRAQIIEEDRPHLQEMLEKGIRTHEPIEMQYRIRRGEGDVRTLRATGRVVPGANGEPLRIYGSVRDITERQNAEADRFELVRQLEETRRVATLGRVAATMAHEFNNVMMGINTFLEVLRRRTAPEAIERSIRGIESGLKRGRTITDQILRYTHAASPVLTPIDLGSWLSGFTPEAQALTGGTATVHAESGVKLRGDVAQLNQVMVNLLMNAKDASPPGARIEIEGKQISGELAEVVVADHGSGIPKDVVPRIFDPLFTTKPRGTGLGLAVVQQVIEAHGGSVSVESESGAGTTFRLRLPIAKPSPARVIPRSLLIIEDDAVVAAALEGVLLSEDVHVRIASNGRDALREIERELPQAIVLDLNLPDGSGLRFYERISERWPRLPVIFISGSFNPRDIANHLQHPYAAFLFKPFEIDQLFAALTRILGASR